MTLWVKKAGTWVETDATELNLKISGAWRNPKRLYVKAADAWRTGWSENQPPPNPTSVFVNRVNGGQAIITWAWPANAEGDYDHARVQQSREGGVFGTDVLTNYPGTSQSRTGLVHGDFYDYRVRFEDDSGLVSSWVQFSPGISGLDTPPGAATITSAVWGTAGFTVNWTNPSNPESDITAVRVYAKESTESSLVQVHSRAWSGGAQSQFVAVRAYDKLHSFRIDVVSPGGTTASPVVTSWAPPAAGTVKDIPAASADSYAFGTSVWRSDTNSVLQGKESLDATEGIHMGAFFYGTALYDACHGHTPVSTKILMIRFGSQGNTGVLNFTCHGYSTKPGGAPGQNGTPWVGNFNYATADTQNWEDIPVGNADAMADGVIKGFGLYTASTSVGLYRVCRGPDTNALAGTIRMEW